MFQISRKQYGRYQVIMYPSYKKSSRNLTQAPPNILNRVKGLVEQDNQFFSMEL